MIEELIEELKDKMRRESLSVYAVSREIGVRWHTVRDWLEGRKKPRGLSEKAIRQFLEN